MSVMIMSSTVHVPTDALPCLTHVHLVVVVLTTTFKCFSSRRVWATVCTLSDRCHVFPILSVCNVGVLWPNGWMDQDSRCQLVRTTEVGLGPCDIVLDGDPAPHGNFNFNFNDLDLRAPIS